MLEIRNQPKNYANQNADEDARCEREIEFEILPLNSNVARQFSEKRNLVEEDQSNSNKHDHCANKNKIFSYALQFSLLSLCSPFSLVGF